MLVDVLLNRTCEMGAFENKFPVLIVVVFFIGEYANQNTTISASMKFPEMRSATF